MSQKFLSSASRCASIGYMLHVTFEQTDTNKVGSCCVHVVDGVQMDTTTPNKRQQHAAGVYQRTQHVTSNNVGSSGADLGGGCRGCAPLPEMTCGFLVQLVFCKKKKELCGLLVLKYSKRRVHPLLKKILDPPLELLANNVQRPFAWPGFMVQFYPWSKLYFSLFQTH